MIEIAFWISTALVVYAYGGYPIALAVVARLRRRTVMKADIRPRVSFIVTAYNEEGRIGEKLENTLRQNYPRDRLEVIVASDGSSDRSGCRRRNPRCDRVAATVSSRRDSSRSRKGSTAPPTRRRDRLGT